MKPSVDHRIILLMGMMMWSGCGLAMTAEQRQQSALELIEQLEGTASVNDSGRVSSVHLANTAVTDSNLKSLFVLREITYCDLSHTAVTDRGTLHLANLTQLQKLYLSHTSLTDAGVRALLKLPGLIVLDLSGTQVTDQVLVLLLEFPRLEHVILQNVDLSADAIRHFQEVRPGCKIVTGT